MGGLGQRRLAGAVVAVCLPVFVLWMPATVEGQDASILVPLPTVVRGAEGSEHLLASEPVPEGLVGMSCSASARAENQSSVHPGNDLVVASGQSQIVLEDVEREPGVETGSEATLVLAEELTVTLVLGPDGVFSAGMMVEVTCEPATTTSQPTSTTSETSTTTAPPTTDGETTTTGGDTTSSTVLGTTTSTTSPPTTGQESSTTAPPTTTDQEPTTTEVTVTTTGPTLPFTGTRGRAAAGTALAALMIGFGMIVVSRRAGRSWPPAEPFSRTVVEIEGIRVTLLRPRD